MKNILFYKTNTGYTKEYVDLLSNRVVPLEIYDIKKINKKKINEANNIFFGGPIKNNVIVGLNKFLKYYKYMKDANIFVFAVGIQPESEEKRELVITANGLDNYHIRLYFLLGGMDINRMKFPQKQIMKIGLKLAMKKEPEMAETIKSRFENPINFVSSSNLDKMVETFHKVNLRK